MLAVLKRRIALAHAYRNVFAPPGPPGDGQLVLHDILRRAGLLEAASADGETALRAEGRRSLALEILQMLRWKEGDIVRLAEAQEEGGRGAADEEG